MPDGPPYTPEMLAHRWNVTGKCIRDMCVRGDLAYFKIGKLYRIPAAAVDEIERVQACNTDSKSTRESGPSSGERMERPSDAGSPQPTGKKPRGHLRILRGPGNQLIVPR